MDGKASTNRYLDHFKGEMCSDVGHIGRRCPQQQRANIPRNPRQVEAPHRMDHRVAQMIARGHSLRITVREPRSSFEGLMGNQLWVTLRVLEENLPAMIDSGSMISILAVGVLARAKKSDFDVDTLEAIEVEGTLPIYDASNNRMKFLGGVGMDVQLVGGLRSMVSFFVADQPGNENVRSLRRVYMSPYTCCLIHAQCEKDEGEVVMWSSKRGVLTGVLKIADKGLTLPIVNDGEDPLIIENGEELGKWSTDKWSEGWENMDLAVSGTASENLGQEDRAALLSEKIAPNLAPKVIEQDLADVLDEFEDVFAVSDREVFAVSDRELTRTNLVKMNIDTGESPPIRLKARPVPLAYICKNNCLAKSKLGDLKGVHFSGPYAKEPIITVWNAWKAASLLIRTDIDVAEKIKHYTAGVMSPDAKALVAVLRLAYDRCRDWTAFICSNAGIKFT
ncbi:hypothetical protein ANCDUO_13923 [Ancylostoma duodenale]|uniref:Peptidase A2 domain-containing protein n=1 Tax=Ancylostoma duodenale TaxID=51022 RepID=A0A0C2D1M6_9BILA|nr:hypothetical protein ANCDUO_13923 [Ancylostoma duodenale]